MTTKKAPTPAKPKQSKKASKPDTPVALTLKVDQQTYVRLCTLGATKRLTNQKLLSEALDQYLKRSGA